MYQEILIAILIIYMNFECIQNNFTICYRTCNVKYWQLNLKIFWDNNNLQKQIHVFGVIIEDQQHFK